MSATAYEYFDLQPARMDMRSAVLQGLHANPKHVSPMYFYDAHGSELFEQITELPEYYLTRTEIALFERHSDEIARRIGGNACVVEYGSGSSRKIRKLLETARPTAYVPVDISADHLQANARALHQDYPWLNVYPTCTDFTQPFSLPEAVASLVKTGFFPGSSIGNFEPPAAVRLLQGVHQTLGQGAHLLIGVDRKKSVALLEAAYDDSVGVTAEFNLNLLDHLNKTLDATFDRNLFRHQATYNAEIGAVQMHLISLQDQSVEVAGETVTFAKDEALHTENSFKYHPEEFLDLAAQAGFTADAQYSDSKEWYSIYLLTAV